MSKTSITSEWNKYFLNKVASIQTGPFGSQLHEKDYVKVGTPIITVENLVNDKIIHSSDTPRVCERDKKRLQKYILQEGDIVFSRVGSVDRSAYVSENEDGWMFSGRLLRVRPDQGIIDKKFLHYWLTQNSIKEFVRRIAVGATMPSINTKILGEISVSFPSLSEQKAIARILSSFDNKIELLRQQNQTLEAMAQTIFKEWFVDFRFPGAGKMVDSELGMIPEGWRMGVLKDEFEIIMGQSPKGESYNENGDGMIFFQGRAEFTDRFPTIRLFTTESKRIAEKFDVLVSVRAPVGDMNVAFDTCCIGRGLGAVRGKYKSYTLYKTKSLMESFKKYNAEGTVFGSINKSSFEGVKTIIPPINLIEQFEKIVSPLDQKIFNNYNQIKTLSQIRDSLLPKLMRGEIKVKPINNN